MFVEVSSLTNFDFLKVCISSPEQSNDLRKDVIEKTWKPRSQWNWMYSVLRMCGRIIILLWYGWCWLFCPRINQVSWCRFCLVDLFVCEIDFLFSYFTLNCRVSKRGNWAPMKKKHILFIMFEIWVSLFSNLH